MSRAPSPAAAGVSLGAGDDVLTLHDGASLATLLWDGGAHSAGDRIVLQADADMAFDGTNTTNFESLSKRGAATATLGGTLTYTGGTATGRRHAGRRRLPATPTLAMADDTTVARRRQRARPGGRRHRDHRVERQQRPSMSTWAPRSSPTATSATAADTVDLAGTLDTQGGTFSLGAGDDTFRTHDTTNVIGNLDAGAGNDCSMSR
jgi:fibronectin-binding autotransporter adhesin